MSLRDSIIAAINDELGYERSRLTPAVADAILSLPELKEMRGKAEKADFYDALPSMRVLREWKEKSEALDILEYGYPQEVQKALEKVRGK